jgi:hypothetical protein
VQGERIAIHVSDKNWTIEVFLPYTAFPDMVRPGTGVEWFGQVTRHRISDSKQSPDSTREYSRMNYKFGGGSANLADFAPIVFVE